MRIANHSLFLKPTVMYLLHFAGKGAKWMGECQQLTSCKHPFDILSPALTAQARTHPPEPRHRGVKGQTGRFPAH